jgi:hypothetical protein
VIAAVLRFHAFADAAPALLQAASELARSRCCAGTPVWGPHRVPGRLFFRVARDSLLTEQKVQPQYQPIRYGFSLAAA